jgi:o-succinylbenzoate synthase
VSVPGAPRLSSVHPVPAAGAALEAHVWSVPMRTRFRGIDVRDGVLVQGPAGWGEFSPFWDYDVAESRRWWAAAHEAAVLGWPDPVRGSIPVNVTVPAVGPERAHAIVVASGCRTAKVKVAERGQMLADDVARVGTVRDALGPGGRVRVDANGGWSVREAVGAICELRGFDLEYVEQPVATVDELRELRRLVDVPIAADESIRRSGDPMRVKLLEAADIAVLKVQPLGGARACLELAEAVGLPVVVSSALESSVGIGFGVALAAALPSLPYACGLATMSMLTHDVTYRPLSVVDGQLPVRRVLPDDDLVAAATPDESVTARWLARLQRCAEVLQERRG